MTDESADKPVDKPVDAATPERVVAWAKHSDSVTEPSSADSVASAAALTAGTAIAVAEVRSENCSDACVHPMYCTPFATTPQLPADDGGLTPEQLLTFETKYLPELRIGSSCPVNRTIASISATGVLTLLVEPSDENAKAFLDTLSAQFKKPITAVEIKPPQSATAPRDFKVGDRLYYVSRHTAADRSIVEVRECGRKWVVLSNGRRFDRTRDGNAWRAVECGDDKNAGTVFDSNSDFAACVVKANIVKALREQLPHGNARLDPIPMLDANLADMQAAAKLLGVEIPESTELAEK